MQLAVYRLERTSKYATLYNHFFCTVLNSSRIRTLFFVLEFLQFCQTKKYVITRGKPEDLVKNLGDYESGFRIPRGQPCMRDRINYNIYHTYQYLLPTKIQESKNLAQKNSKLKKSHDVKKTHCRPRENSVYRLRKTNISLFMNKLFHIRVYLSEP